ncbi:S1 domain-containing RNA-binding protein [Caldibacillus debilis]|jgi:S1 RNA binding domain protein|uniref:S1 motif domain-containing protein n=2 Tax=Caldibacillus debilis TaxID=301148 RepID=A0A150LCQ8_9BACI|nr:S1 domain-containing RNA-binding protein [Caldibacillus debilis]KYD10044.1 hypothetical protein B4135_3620 [Caldibacillus debilis]OUM92771.1 MAG: RNA-binding protein S1 [Caldibacillus debilis]RKO63266.1 putative RNA binding protein (contains ribosomal protein S1 domain) [Caldibacillus debilis GB1]
MSIEVGSKLQGKVTGITKFGAFIELPEGVTGLVHISEVADTYVKDIHDYLKIGDQVEVKVLHVEKNGKIALSIRKAKEKASGSGNHHKRMMDRAAKESFEQKIARFLKESEDRLASLKRHNESRRGGRGGRRG